MPGEAVGTRLVRAEQRKPPLLLGRLPPKPVNASPGDPRPGGALCHFSKSLSWPRLHGVNNSPAWLVA